MNFQFSKKHIMLNCLSLPDGPETIILSPSTPSYTRNEGDSIGSINCFAECEPSCDFEWTYPDGTELNSTTLPQLVLKKSHHGQYKCKASNGIASKVTTITINVNCKYDMLAVFFY